MLGLISSEALMDTFTVVRTAIHPAPGTIRTATINYKKERHKKHE